MVGDIIEIAQFGGSLDNVYIIYEDRVPLEVGDNLVLSYTPLIMMSLSSPFL